MKKGFQYSYGFLEDTLRRAGGRSVRRWLLHAGVVLGCLAVLLASAEVRPERSHALQERGKSSPSFLHAFARVTKAIQPSIVEFQLDGKPAALGTVVGPNGLTLTKASEISSGKLTCQLADGTSAQAHVVAMDEENDLALVQVAAKELKPVPWASEDVAVGQWVITPGADAAPVAVGIVSVHPRKIFPKRAYMGVILDHVASEAMISEIMPGLGADKAGLHAGDVILALNDQLVQSSEQLVNTVRTFREGQTLKLRYRRQAEEHTTNVQLTIPQPDKRWRAFDRQDRMNHLGGELSRRAEGFQMAIQHDTVLQPWQCGGPLLNLDGRVVGLNIARAGRVASYALPGALVQKLLTDLEHEDAPQVQVKLNEAVKSPE